MSKLTKKELEYRLATSYQIVGVLLDYVGKFDTKGGQHVLDWLSGRNVEDPLPFYPDQL